MRTRLRCGAVWVTTMMARTLEVVWACGVVGGRMGRRVSKRRGAAQSNERRGKGRRGRGARLLDAVPDVLIVGNRQPGDDLVDGLPARGIAVEPPAGAAGSNRGANRLACVRAARLPAGRASKGTASAAET